MLELAIGQAVAVFMAILWAAFWVAVIITEVRDHHKEQRWLRARHILQLEAELGFTDERPRPHHWTRR